MTRNTLLIALVVLGLGGFIWWQTSRDTTQVTATPPESGIAEGDPMVTVKVPELTGLARQGERVFNARCAVCHGRNAAGQQGVAPPLVHLIYRPAHHADGAFVIAAQQGVIAHHWTFGNMPPVENVTRGELKAIVAYIRALQKENGIN